MRRVIRYLILAITVVMLIGLSIGVVHAKCLEAQAINPADFESPKDNLYFPIPTVETTYVYQPKTDDEIIRNLITFTTATKEIMGVACTVVHDVEVIWVDDLTAWVPLEDTYDWYAWDNDGNVWYFGEYTEAYSYDEDWTLVDTSTEGSWEAGVDGALPGIVMLADPKPGVCYQQEYYEGEAEDMAEVLSLGESVTVPYGSFKNCLKTKEWTPLEPDVEENKYYAPGVGLVLEVAVKGGSGRVELISISKQ